MRGRYNPKRRQFRAVIVAVLVGLATATLFALILILEAGKSVN